MSKITDFEEPWEGHSFPEVEEFIKEGITSLDAGIEIIRDKTDEQQSIIDNQQTDIETINNKLPVVEAKAESAFNDTNALRIYEHLYFERDKGFQIILPKTIDNRKITITAISARGLSNGECADSAAIKNYTKDNWIDPCGDALYTVGGYPDALIENKYAYDKLDIINRRYERHVDYIYFKDIVRNVSSSAFSWSNSDSKLTINKQAFNDAYPNINLKGLGLILPIFVYTEGITPIAKIAGSTNMTITGLTNCSSKATAMEWLRNDSGGIMFIMIEPRFDEVGNDVEFLNIVDSEDIIECHDNKECSIEVSYLSLEKNVYSKDQIDAKFVTKASQSDKDYINKLSDTEITEETFDKLSGSHMTVMYVATTSEIVPEFIGMTYFYPMTGNAQRVYLVLSNGKMFLWNGEVVSEFGGSSCKTKTITINPDDWSAGEYTIPLSVIVGPNDVLQVSPDDASSNIYYESGIARYMDGNNLVLSAATVPTSAITVNVIYQSGSSM